MSSDPVKDAAKSPVKMVAKNKAKGICVVLEDDFEKENLENLLDAIKQFRGVLDASFIDFDGFDDYINRNRIKIELKNELKDILK